MQGLIRTVDGDIFPHEAGVTYAHEHLIWSPPEPFASEEPDFVMLDKNKAIAEVKDFVSRGGKTIVEMTTMELSRNPIALAEISRACNVNIIAATGFNKAKFSKNITESLSINEIADLMIKDLTIGMENTSVKAGVIKASSSMNVIADEEKKVFLAASKAHLETGAPISTHTEGGTMAAEQVEILTQNGIHPSRILIGHLDRKLDFEYISSIAQLGVMLGFDQIGKHKYAPDQERIKIIKQLVDTGFENQILLSGDMARRSSWKSYNGSSALGLSYLLHSFVPAMLEAGIPEQAVNKIMRHNPARFFAWTWQA